MIGGVKKRNNSREKKIQIVTNHVLFSETVIL